MKISGGGAPYNTTIGYKSWIKTTVTCLHRPAVHLSQNTWKWERKPKVYSGTFRTTFFTFRAPFSVFHTILYRGRHSREKSKDFMVYFFVALIKHKIRMKCEKCRVSVRYFVVCFAKNIREMWKVYSRLYECTVHSIEQHSMLKWSLVYYLSNNTK